MSLTAVLAFGAGRSYLCITPKYSTKQSKIRNCISLFLPFQVEASYRYLHVVCFLMWGANVMSS